MANIAITINARQRSIIYAMLISQRRSTISTLAKTTSLTPRIIRYNLDTVKTWFQNEGVDIISRPGYGIELNLTRSTRKQLLSKVADLDDGALILTGEQRRRSLLLDLLTAPEPVSYQRLGQRESISRSTIINDVHLMTEWLEQFNLTLKRRTRTGIWIEGQEISHRLAILHIILDELGENKRHKLWHIKENQRFEDKSMPVNIETFINQLPLGFCKKIVENIEHNIGNKLSLTARIEVQIYLTLMIYSVRLGKIVQHPIDKKLQSKLEYEVSHIFAQQISKKFKIELPPAEIQVIAASLLGSKWSEANTKRQQITPKEQLLSAESKYFANAMVSICSTYLHPLLKIDQELLDSLAKHLDPVIYRLRYGIPIRNNLLQDIRQTYPEIYRSAEKGTMTMSEELQVNIPPQETGYITLYLAAALERLRTIREKSYPVILISDGIRAKTTLLKSRLELEFPTLKVVGIYNSYDLDEDLLENAKLAITSSYVEELSIPAIQVSPFLTYEEIQIIQKWLLDSEAQERKAALIRGEKQTVVDLLEPQQILFVQSAPNWQEVVNLASEPLLKSGKIQDKYVQAMKNIVVDYGAYMVLSPGVILLHASPTDGVNSLCLSLLLLKEGVVFENSSDKPIDIVFVLGAVDSNSHLTALFQMSNLIENPEFLQELRQSQQPADALRVVWRYLPMIELD